MDRPDGQGPDELPAVTVVVLASRRGIIELWRNIIPCFVYADLGGFWASSNGELIA